MGEAHRVDVDYFPHDAIEDIAVKLLRISNNS